MTAINELPALARGSSAPTVHAPGRVDNSQPTNEPSQPTVAASAGSTTSPQAMVHAMSTAAAPAGIESTRSARGGAAPIPHAPTGSHDILDGQIGIEPQLGLAVEEQSQPTAIRCAIPIPVPLSAATSSPAAIHTPAAIRVAPSGDQPPREASDSATPRFRAPLAEYNTPPAIGLAIPTGGSLGVDEQGQPVSAIGGATPTHCPPMLADPWLLLAAEILDDFEKVRTANENRFRQLTRTEVDADGEQRGFGITLGHSPVVDRLAQMIKALKCDSDVLKKIGYEGAKAKPCCLEHEATKSLEGLLKQHPLGPWVKAQKGIGYKQAARLLAAIRDPYWNDLYDRPRTVSELWAYCGYDVGDDGAARKRARGAKANWSATARMRARLVSESCLRIIRKPCNVDPELGYAVHVDGCQCSPYRVIYDQARAKYAHAVHNNPCAQCGPKGKPAEPGSPLSDGHKLGRALRAASKELLKDLWREAKRIHEMHAP